MTDRHRIIYITLTARCIENTSIIDLARRGNVSARAAITAAMWNDLRACVSASTHAIRETFPGRQHEFLDNQEILIWGSKPDIVM